MTAKENLDIYYRLLNARADASLVDIRNAYLDKTFQNKFQRVIIDDEILRDEFMKYQDAYQKILKSFFSEENPQDLSIHTPEQLFKMFFNQGIYALCKDNHILAGEKLNAASKINNKHTLLTIYLGIILMKRKNYYAAQKYFQDVINASSENDDAWFYAAENFFKAGRFSMALETYEKAKKLNPARQEIAFRIKECKEKIAIKPVVEKKESLLQKIIDSIRRVFEE